MAYYIGVDGGGTKTAYALFNENKEIVAEVKTKGSNHENYEGSFPEAADIIWSGINNLVKEYNITLEDVAFTLMGLAGIDHPFQYDAMCEEMSKRGLKNFDIFNDGFIVVKAGATGKAAIGYNCGTGTCCNAIDLDGRMVQHGGLGEFSDDKGNGVWIATMAYKLIYDDVYLGKEKTAMSKMFYDAYNIHSAEEFLGMVSEMEGDNRNDFIMRLIDFFFDASKLGDKPVLKVIDDMSERGADYIAAHINKLNFGEEPIEIVLSGSIHTKLPSEVYLTCLKEKVAARTDRELRYIKLDRAPVTGCINWIFQDYIK